MAIFYPTIERIQSMKVPPTEGELTLLNFLKDNLGDSFEVYFNPYMNGDRPDIVIVRKRYGVMIIEVKDWDLNSYTLDEKKHWNLRNAPNTRLKSPIEQVLKYKENLYLLHLDELYEKRIKDYKYMKVVSCAVYFHNATQQAVENMMVNPFVNDKKYQFFLSRNITLIGRDKLETNAFNSILRRIYMLSNRESVLFSDSLYESITHFLLPTTHQKEDGKHIVYLKKQKELISKNDQNEFVVEGVEGSGKTTVLAARAVEEYRRAKEKNGENYEPSILILTYNITLVNFIRDKLNQVEGTFEWRCFTILNYHHFIGIQLNNMGIPIILPNRKKQEDEDYFYRKLTPAESKYLDQNYYSNVALFLDNVKKIYNEGLNYDAILVDEMQDYKYNWFEILKKAFLKSNGDYILFGDEKQNIYGNTLVDKKVHTNVKGRNRMNQSVRSGTIVEKLVKLFQKQFYSEKYDIDEFSTIEEEGLPFKPSGTISYLFLDKDFIINIFYEIVDLKNKQEFKNIATDDITILSFNVDVLRQFEALYRNKTHQRAMTMFETKETIVYVNLKKEWRLHKKGEKTESKYLDIQRIAELLSLMQGRDDEDKIKKLSKLLVVFDLNKVYIGELVNQFDHLCIELKCDKAKMESALDKNYHMLSRYLTEIMKKDYDGIREHKKARFYMHPGYIKISTIHSFKGWESNLVILIIDNVIANEKLIDEIVYTGITRCKENLFIINMNNLDYDYKIKTLLRNLD